LAISTGCGRTIVHFAPADPPPRALAEVQVLASGSNDHPDIHGLSALCRAPDGALWSITEREDLLVRLSLEGAALRTEALPLRGKPPGLDGEGLALWQSRADGPLQFAVGTESHGGPRSRDAVLLGHLSPTEAVVDETVWVDYAAWGVQAEDNRGLEGMCWSDGLWVLAETAMDAGRGRWSPLGRRSGDGSWTPLRLPLTSQDGRFSALACRPAAAVHGAGAVELWAIERQLGSSRWVRAIVPAAGAGGVELQTEVVADLAPPVYARLGTVPNFEGIAADRADPEAAWLIADNDRGGMLQGPNLLVLVGRRR
jgi:hypothetical protein